MDPEPDDALEAARVLMAEEEKEEAGTVSECY